jgi:hypothetical protein
MINGNYFVPKDVLVVNHSIEEKKKMKEQRSISSLDSRTQDKISVASALRLPTSKGIGN